MQKILSSLGNIFTGWYFWLTNRNNELAKSRLKICAQCDKRKGMACGVCLCPLQAKARLEDENCPHPVVDKWRLYKLFPEGKYIEKSDSVEDLKYLNETD